jgi:hypothetical protein
MYSVLIVTFMLVPLLLGASFALRYRRELHKPMWAAFIVVAAGYGVALIVSLVISHRTLSLMGLPSYVSFGSNHETAVSAVAPLALAVLVMLNLVLLSWIHRVLPKKY